MVTYFYKKYTKYQLNPIIIKNLYFLEITAVLFKKIGAKNNQFFNTNFLFYSILSFYTWVRYIIGQRLSLLLIIEDTDLTLIKLLFAIRNFNFISENAWIPGILSNSQEIWNGERYIQAIQESVIEIEDKPDFLFLCSTKRALVSHEANSQLIPQIAILSSITNPMSNYFISLFIPKLLKEDKKKKNYIYNFQKGLTLWIQTYYIWKTFAQNKIYKKNKLFNLLKSFI